MINKVSCVHLNDRKSICYCSPAFLFNFLIQIFCTGKLKYCVHRIYIDVGNDSTLVMFKDNAVTQDSISRKEKGGQSLCLHNK